MQVGGHAQVQPDRVRRGAAHLECVRVRHELAERDRPVDRQPARRVVRLARRARIDVRDRRRRPRQRGAAEHERRDRVVDFGGRAARDDEQLAAGCGRIVRHCQQRAVHRRQREAGRQRRRRADHDCLIVGRQRRRDRKARMPIVGQRAEPRREHARTAQRRRIGRRGQHERQPHEPVVAAVEERRGQQREIVRQTHRRLVENQFAGRAHVRPQRGVGRILAVIERVMRDQPHADLIEIGEVARIDRDVLRDRAAGLRGIERDRRDHLAVDRHLQMRHREHERRRIRIGQAQPRARHDTVEPHACVDRARIVGAAQPQRLECAERRERHTYGRRGQRGRRRTDRRARGRRRQRRCGARRRRDGSRRAGRRHGGRLGRMECAGRSGQQDEPRHGRHHARLRSVRDVRSSIAPKPARAKRLCLCVHIPSASPHQWP